MKIAIDVSPLESGHKIRGTGFYLYHLKNALLKYHPEHAYIFFSQKNPLMQSVDIVHYPYFEPFFLTLPLFKKQKTVVTVHDLTPLVFPQHFPSGIKGSVKWYVQKNSLKQVSAILTDSECSKKDIASIVGFPEEKISVVYLAAGEEFKIQDLRKIQEIKKKYHLPEKFVLYVGDVTWNKNLPRLVMAAVEASLPLVLTGKTLAQDNVLNTNPWLSDLHKTLELLEGKKNIIRLGFVPSEDLVTLYAAARVFAMPSMYEGFGLPVVEAMACGTPVVTSNKGSLGEIAGDAAYIVNPSSVESISEGLAAVFTKDSLQQSLRKKGLLQAKNFSWEKTADETVAVYGKVFNSK